LAQLLLDPFYRTLKGFGILLQKEWISFGYNFEEKSGTGYPEDHYQEEIPLFIQWIDAVKQIMVQHRNHFEFNENYLLPLIDHVYSNRFGSFLCSNEKERRELKINEKTLSIWPWLSDPKRKEKFTNPNYIATNFRLNITFSTALFEVWLCYYQRYTKKVEEMKLKKRKKKIVVIQIIEKRI